jgi:hypothetical protein
MSIRIRAAALTAACTLGICSAAAANAGQRSFEQTYPIASKLCAKVAKGDGPKRLRSSAAKVLADCETLQASFKANRLAVISTDTSIAAARTAEHASVLSACGGTLVHKPSCSHARRKGHKVIEGLEAQRVHAARGYYKATEAARRAFWAQIHALPGGAKLRADNPIPVQNS